MQEDLKNVTEASPHTAFNSLVCAGKLPQDPGVLALWARGVMLFRRCPFTDLPLLYNVLLLTVDSHELLGLARMLSFPLPPTPTRYWIVCFLYFSVIISNFQQQNGTQGNEQQSPSFPLRRLLLGRKRISTDKAVGALEPYTPLAGDAERCRHCAPTHQKVKYRLTKGSSDSPWGTYPKELKAGAQTGICTLMCIGTLFTRAKRRKQPKWPPKNR